MNDWILTAILAAFAALTCGVQLVTASDKLEANDRSKLARQFRTFAASLFFNVAVCVVGGIYFAWGATKEPNLSEDVFGRYLIGGFCLSGVAAVWSAVRVSLSLFFDSKDIFSSDPPRMQGDQYLSSIADSLNEFVSQWENSERTRHLKVTTGSETSGQPRRTDKSDQPTDRPLAAGTDRDLIAAALKLEDSPEDCGALLLRYSHGEFEDMIRCIESLGGEEQVNIPSLWSVKLTTCDGTNTRRVPNFLRGLGSTMLMLAPRHQ